MNQDTTIETKTRSRPVFRSAIKKDITQLLVIENRCFARDTLSARSFHWMLEKGHADIILIEVDHNIVGYSLLLYRRGTSLARLYSIAILPECQGSGLGTALLKHAEQAAQKHDCVYLRLEVRSDNTTAIACYKRLGYRQFDTKQDYYEDHSAALCFEKRIIYPHPVSRLKVPFYRQTTEFSCGPASLLMAMAGLKQEISLSQAHELQLWRESTTIFMTAGHGGCGPHGLALAAYRRGFDVDMYLSHKEALFVDSVRNPEKRDIISLVQRDFMRQLEQTQVRKHYHSITMPELVAHLDEGRIPLILISTYRINRNKAPHWVLLTAHDPHFIYMHDPDVDTKQYANDTDNFYVPISKPEFVAMAKFGRTQLRAAVVISRRESFDNQKL
ncbi:ribosomal-protein-alanine acetyltransferase [Nitrosomonas cryotolerans]|uniref:Ribosomal-protein-alanine acetyltransferase n=1 Tax=Nitrosomonas cryotolerans ATCC 49181 TaxID=1131553 RepID=A0A1N6II92_9PROT|nr:GNAT family N-acetyltransferase/peptidase C39 family protein [Nitrosomonas cryotolerans]SFP89976.1 ribosomal-protein-alanine acetyltransferase [Nitrosomonas cryotolerans]SIO31726.1 ribosomal-protein-alanine acetyltransferase [Nitrosomonas cryotolerans ATCC 49181]